MDLYNLLQYRRAIAIRTSAGPRDEVSIMVCVAVWHTRQLWQAMGAGRTDSPCTGGVDVARPRASCTDSSFLTSFSHAAIAPFWRSFASDLFTAGIPDGRIGVPMIDASNSYKSFCG